VVRLLRIENETQVGPARVALASKLEPTEVGEQASPAVDESKPAPKGIQPATADSLVVLGKEGIRAYLEIDLIKFIDQKAAATASATR
jgi:hypothetical protein